MNDNTKVLAAMLAGVAAGVAIGILFAPEKGSETRVRLTDSLKNLGDNIKDMATSEMSNLKDKMTSGMKSGYKTGEHEYSKGRSTTDSAFNKAEGDLNSTIKS